MNKFPVQGAGLGFKRALMGPLAEESIEPIDFFEIAPENWLNIGGHLGKKFRTFTERYPFLAHGLSLSLGGPAPLDEDFLGRVKKFLDSHNIPLYTEHLSYCTDNGHLYDLMPIPFTEEAVHYVAGRIQRTQEILERKIAIENVSYYAAPGQEMSEVDFVNAVLEEADCYLHLDVNNIYVNSVNHKYDAEEFLYAMPGERIVYIHVAGHYQEAEDLLIDTHGAEVIDPVWNLLDKTYQRFGGNIPTLLERDFNLPALSELKREVGIIASLQNKWTKSGKVIAHV
ncbi:MAG: DUF692 domain-containing protein [Gammaproteobacteria bacterium]|nr:DUF692 domain-containing protein [Gammaproteobacteria bacterium]MDH5592780.1 DUF692 domain-containing protein [Gammaproteobacteria bacterium]